MKIFRPVLSGLGLAASLLQTLPAYAGAGGFSVPAHYHPLDNLWKIALTIAVIWIIIRLRRRA
jgi:hypothetical protein